MSHHADRARAQGLARDALAWLAERDLVPTPQHYEVAFAYVAGENTDLRRYIDGLIAKSCKFDANIMAMLHARYFKVGKESEAVVELGEKISTKLDTVLKLLETAGRDSQAYGSTLSKASGELGARNVSEGKIKALIDNVIQATRAMEARSKTLELQLQTSSSEVNVLRERLESVRRESLTDPLTGISNRKAFETELAESIERAIETGEPLSLVMCDIDHFKSFNDTWGHQTGDQVLRLVANCISENVKGRDTAARYGGEEFAIILPQTSLSDAVGLANQIRSKVESKKLVKKSTGDILGVITISMGASQYNPIDSAEEFVQRADDCLYAAKKTGRNRVVGERDAAAKANKQKATA